MNEEASQLITKELWKQYLEFLMSRNKEIDDFNKRILDQRDFIQNSEWHWSRIAVPLPDPNFIPRIEPTIEGFLGWWSAQPDPKAGASEDV